MSWQTQLQQSPLAQRWQALPARDRFALAALSGFLLLVCVYVLAWLPVQRYMHSASEDFQRQRTLHALISQNAPQLQGRSVASPVVLAADELQGLLTASAQQQGLRLQRLDVQQPGWIEVQLEAVTVTALLAWLGQLQARGVVVEEVNLTRTEPGKADARLALSVGGF
ncbi:type II secretion system protein M [Atopomonas hussainii]|uniref:type II secretion system protein M n=1 Tax=Atopomonas hussainii TaxID=1429083 RepID=UPI0008FFED5C|nr:type II secretion system protein M [Atopomonas hussainii]